MNENNTNPNQITEIAETAMQIAPSFDRYDLSNTEATRPAFTSLDTTTAEGRKKLYNITNHPDYSLSDYINKTILVKDIYVDVNTRLNNDPDDENCGVVEEKPRTILIDVDGKSYMAGVSIGVFNSVREILRIFGHPSTWDAPIAVMPVHTKVKRGNMLSLEIV